MSEKLAFNNVEGPEGKCSAVHLAVLMVERGDWVEAVLTKYHTTCILSTERDAVSPPYSETRSGNTFQTLQELRQKLAPLAQLVVGLGALVASMAMCLCGDGTREKEASLAEFCGHTVVAER